MQYKKLKYKLKKIQFLVCIVSWASTKSYGKISLLMNMQWTFGTF